MIPLPLLMMAGSAAVSLFGGSKQASAAKAATNAQTQAADQQIAMQQRMYDQTRADNEPWRQAGVGALGQLNSRFGLAPPTMASQPGGAPDGGYLYSSQSPPGPSAGDAYLSVNPDLAAEWQRIAGKDDRFRTADDYVAWHKSQYPGEQRLEGLSPAAQGGAGSAGQETVVRDDPASLYAYDPTVANTGGYAAPSRDGYTAPHSSLPGFNGTLQPRQEFAPLDVSADAYHKSPGYDFQMSEGLKAANAGMGPAGNLNSGRRMMALQERGQGIADQDYGDWRNYTTGQYNLSRGRADNIYESDRGFTANQGNADRARGDALYAADRGYAADRYDTNTSDIMAMAGIGRQASAANQNAGAQFADAYGQATGAAADARSAGAINSANVWTNSIGNLMQAGSYLYGSGAFGAGGKAPAAGAAPPFNPASLY